MSKVAAELINSNNIGSAANQDASNMSLALDKDKSE